MKGKTKAAVYVAAATVVGILAYGYFREHTLVLHQAAQASRFRMMVYLVLLLLFVGILSWYCAAELKHIFARLAERWMVQAASPVEPVPELQEAERARASGDPLEAIRLLREYLQANPYELHAMARIAEIYRYDLQNDLAAALEYEELLKHPLPDDRWSWAALHLAKLYGRMNELDKSVALLERIGTEFGHTVAGHRAKKALERVRDPGAITTEEDDPEAEGES